MSQAAGLERQAHRGSDYYSATLNIRRANLTHLRKKVEVWKDLTVMESSNLAHHWGGEPENEQKGDHLHYR